MNRYYSVAVTLLPLLRTLAANTQMCIDDLARSVEITTDDVYLAAVILSDELNFSYFDGSKITITEYGKDWIFKVGGMQ